MPPARESVKWYAMVYLFEPDVWFYIGVSCVVITALMFAHFYQEDKVSKGSKRSTIYL